uniref:Src homology 2 domain containing F n=1 Tax=Sinocyclocheilus grahami TaxID=75366 RepID=A0A672LVH7_SINGR
MARWFKEHLGFKTTKAPPPAPPKPDYRHFHTAVSSLQTPPGTGLLSAQPDILTAYKLQKELDFEDPYTPGGTVPFSTGPSSAAEVKYVSPKHRLIKVEAVRPPCSPPADPENEDYADPFDAADQAGGTQTVTEKPTENDGYMEPYEAQKMMADGPVRQLPLYDTPYEPEENGGDPDGDLCSRESRLPQDDERPPEEYDQPWEWKKDHISKAFAGSARFIIIFPEVIHNTEQSEILQVLCPPSVGERIDPAVPLESQLSSQGFMHMKLSRTKDSKYVLGQNSCLFDSVPEIIHFYSSRKLPIKGAEHMSLLYPVAIRTL